MGNNYPMETPTKLSEVTAAWSKPFCAGCRKEMWLIRIEPDEPGYERRSFECAGCGQQENVLTPSP